MPGTRERADHAGRALGFRTVLSLVALSTGNALRVVLTDWPQFVAAFPGAASLAGRACAIALPVSLLLSLLGLWRFRRWGLWLIGATTVATFGFDLWARGPKLHLAAAVLSVFVMAAAGWPHRRRFRGGV